MASINKAEAPQMPEKQSRTCLVACRFARMELTTAVIRSSALRSRFESSVKSEPMSVAIVDHVVFFCLKVGTAVDDVPFKVKSKQNHTRRRQCCSKHVHKTKDNDKCIGVLCGSPGAKIAGGWLPRENLTFFATAALQKIQIRI